MKLESRLYKQLRTCPITTSLALFHLLLLQACLVCSAVHIYLCDDSPKDFKEHYNGQTFLTVALRQQMIDALFQVHGVPVIRVTRVKGKGETNPKSANLNNCLKQIYGDAIPPTSEVVGVFDADQAAHSHFFTATLPWMDAGDDVALVQSPQVVHIPIMPQQHCIFMIPNIISGS